MQVLLDEKQIEVMLDQIAKSIAEAVPAGSNLALVGVRSRGEVLAQRLQKLLGKYGWPDIDRGALDITLYRDDINQMGSTQPAVRTTEIDFNIDNRLIVLVDDVLNTGRSVRAALDALVDLGRPKAIWLAVLIDRGCRELPICADFVGKVVDADPEKRVNVYVKEMDGREEIVLE